MKFYIYSYKIKENELNNLKKLVEELYSLAKIRVGKSNAHAHKDDIVIKADDVLEDSNYKTAINICNLAGIGVSEKVLKKL